MWPRLIVIFALIFVAGSGNAAGSLTLESLSVGSTTYSNVVVLGANSTDLYFTHAHGIANVKLRLLSPELQKVFHFDPKAAGEAERRQLDDDARYQQMVAASMAEHSSATQGNSSPTYPESLADPVSEKSFLGKAAPDLGVEKWLTEKPKTEGKFVLVSFWAPWSTACRKVIPELNAIQKQCVSNLAVVGISSELEVNSDPGFPDSQFALGADSKSRLRSALGVTSVPCVVLLDPSGVIRYQGHPAALDPKKLGLLLAKFAQKEESAQK